MFSFCKFNWPSEFDPSFSRLTSASKLSGTSLILLNINLVFFIMSDRFPGLLLLSKLFHDWQGGQMQLVQDFSKFSPKTYLFCGPHDQQI